MSWTWKLDRSSCALAIVMLTVLLGWCCCWGCCWSCCWCCRGRFPKRPFFNLNTNDKFDCSCLSETDPLRCTRQTEFRSQTSLLISCFGRIFRIQSLIFLRRHVPRQILSARHPVYFHPNQRLILRAALPQYGHRRQRLGVNPRHQEDIPCLFMFPQLTNLNFRDGHDHSDFSGRRIGCQPPLSSPVPTQHA